MLSLFLLSTAFLFAFISLITGEGLFMIGLAIPTIIHVFMSGWFPELFSDESPSRFFNKNQGNLGKIISYKDNVFEIKEIYEANGIKKYKCRGLTTQKQLRVPIDDEEIEYIYDNKMEYRQHIYSGNEEDQTSNKLK